MKAAKGSHGGEGREQRGMQTVSWQNAELAMGRLWGVTATGRPLWRAPVISHVSAVGSGRLQICNDCVTGQIRVCVMPQY